MSKSLKEEFIHNFQNTLEYMYETMKKKNADYCGSEDPFKNFRLIEALGVASIEQGFIVRMSDKISRVASLIANNSEGLVEDERITDTLVDLANYAVLMKTYLQSKK